MCQQSLRNRHKSVSGKMSPTAAKKRLLSIPCNDSTYCRLRLTLNLQHHIACVLAFSSCFVLKAKKEPPWKWLIVLFLCRTCLHPLNKFWKWTELNKEEQLQNIFLILSQRSTSTAKLYFFKDFLFLPFEYYFVCSFPKEEKKYHKSYHQKCFTFAFCPFHYPARQSLSYLPNEHRIIHYC
jgi:hypothetical protein